MSELIKNTETSKIIGDLCQINDDGKVLKSLISIKNYKRLRDHQNT